jgi:hypothetical protein
MLLYLSPNYKATIVCCFTFPHYKATIVCCFREVKLFYSEQETPQANGVVIVSKKNEHRSSAPTASLELQSHEESIAGTEYTARMFSETFSG